jgi:hypothetical protein
MVTFFGLLVAALVFLFWFAVFVAGVIIVVAIIAGVLYLIALAVTAES